MLQKLITYFAREHPNKFTHVFYWLICRPSGLSRPKKDDRDLKTEQLGWSPFGYTPKFTRKVNDTLSVKDQRTFNTCVFNGTTTMHEPNEGKLLAVKFIVAWAKKLGLITGTGFTDIRTGFKMLQQYGICEDSLLPDNNNGDFDDYTNVDLGRFQANADTHKIQSYWSVSSRSDILKLLDEGKILGTGLPWYSGFNQGGGFSFPWLISKFVGWLLGGHFVTIKGYDLNYEGRKVYVCQNTYGALWGDSGNYYVDMDFMEKNDYGIWAILDMPVDYGKFLTQFDGKNVKGKGPTIYHIQKGQKKAYLHEMDYFVWNINDPTMKNFEIVDDAILSKVPDGPAMDITKSDYWPILKHLDQPLNITRVIEAIKLNK